MEAGSIKRKARSNTGTADYGKRTEPLSVLRPPCRVLPAPGGKMKGHLRRIKAFELMEALDGNDALFELWGAVLLQAIEDFHRKGASFEIVMNGIRLGGRTVTTEIRRNKHSADAWFKSTGEDVGSFLWICDLFKLDADRVRAEIRRRNFQPTR